MRHCRMDIVNAARNCLHENKRCPRRCPLLQEENCQKIIFREMIRMYDELEGRETDDEDESVCEEEETQAET